MIRDFTFRLLRSWRCRGLAPGALREFLAAPLPSARERLVDCPLIAVDFELTGLDPHTDHICSVGWVCVDRLRVRLDTLSERPVRAPSSVAQSAAVHGLRDQDLREAEPLDRVLPELLRAASGRLLVFHHADLDLAFLQQWVRERHGFSLPLVCLDTLRIEQRRRERQSGLPAQPLRLGACRERYGLPALPQHSAAIDARATAELLLAQLAHAGHDLRLAQLQRRSGWF